jgi:hypothetical protein
MLLLGQPWLYDRRVHHDGYKNTYSFTKEGKDITDLPVVPSSTTPAHNVTLSTLIQSDVREYRAVKGFFILRLDNDELTKAAIPPSIRPL